MDQTQISQRLLEIRERGNLRRLAAVTPQGVNLEARTVELSFSSETDSVERWFGVEILDHSPGACDLTLLNNGAPLLWGHDLNDQRGVVESARIDGDRKGRAVVRFSKSEDGEQLLQDIADGVVTKVSVGYLTFGMEHAGERNGVDAFRVTSWQPYEISMVSVPADDSVGVGRSLQTIEQQHEREFIQVKNTFDLAGLMRAAREKKDGIQHYDGAGNFRGYTPISPSAMGQVRLTDLLPSIPVEMSPEYAPISAKLANNKLSLATALMEASQVVQAGATIIPVATAPMPENSPVIAWYRRAAKFSTIAPALFGQVADGVDVAVATFPAHRAEIDIGDAPTAAVSFEFTRRQQKDVGEDQLAAELAIALALGLARYADSVLLSAINASAPAPFSLSAAAAKGLRFGELSALVGTTGAGASIGQDGVLRAAGVRADLTDTMAGTFVGAFSRAAIAVHDDIPLYIERTGKQGTLKATAFVNVRPLLSDPAAFWSVEPATEKIVTVQPAPGAVFATTLAA
ncbi:HK97 family phage prohead protease [Cupriavidus metallidurans]|uniref:HK97 family phage prohead protease n=1 Tax=Cupriavidus TaxID=106589 RepID=UPI00069207C3|nr:HK97 family phage prohead protease [Cupriavidus metallidurans]KWW37560.1 hypothetical protein AU374_01325 [Cupriavidus metallidurans]MDE4918700.1 HK97 family phage prohead protease [Cupriavidus metallidurans]